jgi:hypothetical protein
MNTPKMHLMKLNPKLAILMALLLLPCATEADTLTLVATNLSAASFTVPSNVVAQVVFAGGSEEAAFSITIQGVNILLPTENDGSFRALPIITGPATISITNRFLPAQGASVFACTIQTSPATLIPTNSVPFVPSTAVVIPADNGGPVTIILESSVDLVNWTPALPGTYGTSTSNRFFRVRAQR